MRRGVLLAIAVLVCTAAVAAGQTPAATPAPAPSSPTVTITGYVQPQIDAAHVDDGIRDKIFFRRAVAGVRTTLTETWSGALLVDFAPGLGRDDDSLRVLDGYLRYAGIGGGEVTITAGNQKVPFSRSVLFSSSRRGLIERSFTGERGFGAPGRALGVQADGRHREARVQWAAALSSVYHAPNVAEVRLDGITEADDSWNEGLMTTGRVEWHPRGAVAREQGDLERGPWRMMAGLASYVWRNDGDRNPFTEDGQSTSGEFADLDSAAAVELSAGVRGRGLSTDVAWTRTGATLLDRGFDGGLYTAGRAALQQFSTEAGLMIVPRRLEALGAVDSLSIAARPSIAYRTSLGMNWYMNGHRLKISAMHREHFNVRGETSARAHTTYVQAQFAF